MSDPYLLVKWLHILSSTVLFGTGIGTAFQMVWAFRSARVAVIHAVARAVVVADLLFTTPAGLVQPLSGILLAHLAGISLLEPWLIVTYALYMLAFLCWAPVVVLQIRIRDLTSEEALRKSDTSKAVDRLYRWWFLLGWPAFMALVAVFFLMVAKPQLWG